MKQTNRFWKFVLFSLLITLAVAGSISYFLWKDLSALQQQAVLSIFLEHSEYILCIVLVCLTVLYAGLEVIYATHIKPVKKISSEAGLIYASNPSHRLQMTGGRDLRRLSCIINNFADMFENLNQNITEQILSAKKEIERERNLLAAIMTELPQGVLICNLDGRILLYNSLASGLLLPDDSPAEAGKYLSLGRSVFHLLDKKSIRTAVQIIQSGLAAGDKMPVACFTNQSHRGTLINVETTPVLDQEGLMSGFILALQDLDADIRKFSTARARIREFARQFEKKGAAPGAPLPCEGLAAELLEEILPRIPTTRTDIGPVMDQIQADLSAETDIRLEILPREVNYSFELDRYLFSNSLIRLLTTLQQITGENRFFITHLNSDTLLMLDVLWKNTPVSGQMIFHALEEPVSGTADFFYMLHQNHAELEIDRSEADTCSRVRIKYNTSGCRIKKNTSRSPVMTGSRPEFYDFNLFRSKNQDTGQWDRDLMSLTYTVFDTETTGLNPDRGDEIISIAAVRIVNGKIIYQDMFDSLVDPERDVPITSYKIHGISHDMVQGKPNIKETLPKFKKFVSDSVLVGHNLAFDMKMLKVKEKVTGIRFTNPVLDTLLLSAVLHPVHETHDLENIARRLGVEIVGRHTALGDAIATAKIFLKLMPVLNDSGIRTLRQAVAAAKKSYYARLKY